MGCGNIFVSACTEGSFVGSSDTVTCCFSGRGDTDEHVTQFYCRARVIIHRTLFTESSVKVKDINVIVGVMTYILVQLFLTFRWPILLPYSG